jgi:hypothetical protein
MAEDKGRSALAGCPTFSRGYVPRRERLLAHYSFSYSALLSFRIGISESASFHSIKRSWYAAFALALSPDIAKVCAICNRALTRMGSVNTMPGWANTFWNSSAASP